MGRYYPSISRLSHNSSSKLAFSIYYRIQHAKDRRAFTRDGLRAMPVSRVLSAAFHPLGEHRANGHLSRPSVAGRLQRFSGHGEQPYASPSILRRTGFTARTRHRAPGELLPRLSILACQGHTPGEGGLFLLHFPWSRLHRELSCVPLYGARTFLMHPHATVQHPQAWIIRRHCRCVNVFLWYLHTMRTACCQLRACVRTYLSQIHGYSL